MKGQKPNIDRFSDVELNLSVEVGKKTEPLAKVLRLKEGDIIKLDKSTEEYVDIYLNGQKFAIGEVVVVNDRFGVRIVDLA